MADFTDADAARAYLDSLSSHHTRLGDTSKLNPQFAISMANAIQQAKAAGLPVGLGSGFRTPGQTGSRYDAGGNSSHSYGVGGDVSGLDGANGSITKAFAPFAEANGLHNPYGLGDAAEFNHWQLPAQPLEKTPELLASLQQASATGNMRNVWNAFNVGGGGTTSQPGRPATPTPTQTTMFSGLNADARGMRNNNPGNLVANDWTASLPGYKGSDGKFAIFDTPQHGAGALDQNLAHYGTRGINTPFGIASTWAPGSDNNNPSSYGARIAQGLGVGLNDKININDPAIRAKVAQAIGLVENGPGKSAGFSVGVPGTTLNTSGAPAAPAGGPGAPAAPRQPGQAPTGLAGAQAGKMASSAQKKTGGDAGGSGGDDQPPPMPQMQLPQPMASGGPMMMGAGGQNTFGQRAAQQYLAQQGFSLQPSIAAGVAPNAQPTPQMMPAGQATGVPSLPGTTLNSPSQLQMALMTGQMSPYDIYAQQQAAGGGGSNYYG